MGLALVGHLVEEVAGRRKLGQTEHLDRRRRARTRKLVATVVGHRADAAPRTAGHNIVAGIQRTVSNQHVSNRTSSTVEVGFEHDTLRGNARVRGELEKLRLKQNVLEEAIDAFTGDGGAWNEDGVATPILGLQTQGRELVFHRVWVRLWLVDLVDRDDDGHVGRLGVGHGLFGLGHDAVVGGHHQDDDVGRLSATGTHRGECFVTRRIEEHDRAPAGVDAICADVLGDAARLASNDVGLANLVQE